MAKNIITGKTICDYVDLQVTYQQLINTNSLRLMSLNRYEWHEFTALMGNRKLEYFNCASGLTDTQATYKNVFVFYDGSDDDSDEYKFHFEAMQAALQDYWARQNNPAPGVDLTGFPAQGRANPPSTPMPLHNWHLAANQLTRTQPPRVAAGRGRDIHVGTVEPDHELD